MSASPAPILYHVDRVRDGRSYATRAVRAQQNGNLVFIMLCSFQRPEPWQVSLKMPPPPDVPRPDQCPFVWERVLQQLKHDTHPRVKEYVTDYAHVRISCWDKAKRSCTYFIHRRGRRASYQSSLLVFVMENLARGTGCTGIESGICQTAARPSRRFAPCF